MNSPRICKYCGEYVHSCKCAAAKTIAQLFTELALLKCVNGEMLTLTITLTLNQGIQLTLLRKHSPLPRNTD